MGYAHAIIPKVADKLPNDYKLTDEEILSEIWVTCDGNVGDRPQNNFRFGGLGAILMRIADFCLAPVCQIT